MVINPLNHKKVVNLIYVLKTTNYYNNSLNWDNGILYIGSHLVSADWMSSDFCNIKMGTTTIANWTFYEYGFLTSITIPNSIVFIGDRAFEYCDNLKHIYYQGTDLQKNKIQIGMYNDNLFNANWHYQT